jgi:hypothetical protein
MLDQKLSDDIDTLQMIVSVGYLCVSKAILQNPHNLNLYKDRLLIMNLGREALKYTVMSALNLGGNLLRMKFADSEARDVIYKMEIADLELHP